MLEDFIEVNCLKAELIDKAIFGQNAAKCKLIIREPTSLKPLLIVHLLKDDVSIEKISKLFPGAELKEPKAKEVFYITGYRDGYLPPISIYGVIVLIDKKAAQREKLDILVGDERTLEISIDEIKKANDECVVCDVTW